MITLFASNLSCSISSFINSNKSPRPLEFSESGCLFTKGILSGGVAQGLFTPKSFKLIYKKE